MTKTETEILNSHLFVQVGLLRSAGQELRNQLKAAISQLKHNPYPCHPACNLCTQDIPEYEAAIENWFGCGGDDKMTGPSGG